MLANTFDENGNVIPTIDHVKWVESDYNDQLKFVTNDQLKFVTNDRGIVERAELHTLIRGKLFAVVRRKSGFVTYFDTYRVFIDGTPARKAIGTSGSIPQHYIERDGDEFDFVHCNDSGEVPRRTPCSHCKARHKKVA